MFLGYFQELSRTIQTFSGKTRPASENWEIHVYCDHSQASRVQQTKPLKLYREISMAHALQREGVFHSALAKDIFQWYLYAAPVAIE